MWFQSALAIFSSGFCRTRLSRRQQRPSGSRLRLEELEDRSLPSALNVSSNLSIHAPATVSGTLETHISLTREVQAATDGSARGVSSSLETPISLTSPVPSVGDGVHGQELWRDSTAASLVTHPIKQTAGPLALHLPAVQKWFYNASHQADPVALDSHPFITVRKDTDTVRFFNN